jgi:hypothetical protein
LTDSERCGGCLGIVRVKEYEALILTNCPKILSLGKKMIGKFKHLFCRKVQGRLW